MGPPEAPARPRPPTHLVWKTSVKSCSRKSTRDASLRISFTYTCTTTASGPFSYESFLTKARLTMGSGSAWRPRLSARPGPLVAVPRPAARLGLRLPQPHLYHPPGTQRLLPPPSPLWNGHLSRGLCSGPGQERPGHSWGTPPSLRPEALASPPSPGGRAGAPAGGPGAAPQRPPVRGICGPDQPWADRAVPPPRHCSPHPSPSPSSHPARRSPGWRPQPGRGAPRPGAPGPLCILPPRALFGDAQPSWHWALPGPRAQPPPPPHHGPGPASGSGPPALPGGAQGLAPGQWERTPARSPGTAALAPTPAGLEVSSAKDPAVRPCPHLDAPPHPALPCPGLTRREGQVSRGTFLGSASWRRPPFRACTLARELSISA